MPVKCMVCGKEYRNLTNHVYHAHGISGKTEYLKLFPGSEFVSKETRDKMSASNTGATLLKWMSDNPEQHAKNSADTLRNYNISEVARSKNSKIQRELYEQRGYTNLTKWVDENPELADQASRNGGLATGEKNLVQWRKDNPELASEHARRACLIGFNKRWSDNPEEVRQIARENNRYRKYPYTSVKYNIDTIFCSSWEVEFVQICEIFDDISTLTYEPFGINYTYEGNHTYYPDFLVEFKDGSKFLVEVKPKYLAENDPVNLTKFDSAREYCLKLGIKFVIVTEDLIFIKDEELPTSAKQLLSGVEDIV